MTNIQRRVQKLELQFSKNEDGSGLTPHSKEWLEFWIRWLQGSLAGEVPGTPRKIPIEAYRAVMSYADELGNDEIVVDPEAQQAGPSLNRTRVL
jgi:hypothetical protein